MNLVIYYTSYFRYSTAISILMQEVQSESIPYYISRVMFCGVKQVAISCNHVAATRNILGQPRSGRILHEMIPIVGLVRALAGCRSADL